MFTFSREFLETFDRRFEDLQPAEGRDFVLGARDWLEWVRSDVRTKFAVDELLRESEAAKGALRAVVQRHLPKFVELRKQLEELGAPADRPPPAPDDIEGCVLEPYSFRAFDKHSTRLQQGYALLLQAFVPVTDPLAPLRDVLRVKLHNFLGPILLPDGAWRPATEEETRARLDKLSNFNRGEAEAAYQREIEIAGMKFYASATRSLRLLIEILDAGLTGTWSPEPSWFDDPVSCPPDLTTRLLDFSSAVLLSPPRESEELQKRQRAMSEWSFLLRSLLRSAYSGLRTRLGERVLLLGAIDRFRLRCELHDVERLRAVALKETTSGIRKIELRLTQELARYLFDAGYDTFSEVSRGEGRVDLVQHGEVYVEAKQISSPNSAARRIIKGFHEAMDGVRQFQSMNAASNVKAVVLAVYVLEGPLYAPVRLIPGQNGAPDTHVVVIDLRDSPKRGATKPQPAVEIGVDEFLAPAVAERVSPPSS